jgi:pseudouridine-5'-phosphate glycosidase
MARYIDSAIEEANRRGITGKAVTPFLLSYLFEKTGGRSLTTNVALVKNNAALAAQIAVSLSRDTAEVSETRS